MKDCNCRGNKNKIVTLAKKLENMAKKNRKYIWTVKLDENATIQFNGTRFKVATVTSNIMKAMYEAGSHLVDIETSTPKTDVKEK